MAWARADRVRPKNFDTRNDVIIVFVTLSGCSSVFQLREHEFACLLILALVYQPQNKCDTVVIDRIVTKRQYIELNDIRSKQTDAHDRFITIIECSWQPRSLTVIRNVHALLASACLCPPVDVAAHDLSAPLRRFARLQLRLAFGSPLAAALVARQAPTFAEAVAEARSPAAAGRWQARPPRHTTANRRAC